MMLVFSQSTLQVGKYHRYLHPRSYCFMSTLTLDDICAVIVAAKSLTAVQLDGTSRVPATTDHTCSLTVAIGSDPHFEEARQVKL